jgi:diguanylate cyclase (GGDEF)-like protein/PAS domain S-box-containing protein
MVSHTISLVKARTARARERELGIFRSLLNHLPAFISYIDATGRYRIVNKRYEEWFQRPREQIEGRRVSEVQDPDAFRTIEPHLQTAFKGKRVNYQNRIPDLSGTFHTFDTSYLPYRLANGKVAGCFVFVTDVTQQHETGKALRESQDRLQMLIDGLRVITWEADPKTWNFTFVSGQAEAITGFPCERWYEPNFWVERIHPEDRAWAVDYCLRASTRGVSHDFEYRFMTATGEPIWFRDIVSVDITDGVPSRLSGVMVDITDRMQAEERLAQQKERALVTLASIGDAVITTDAQGRIEYVNPVAERLTGWSQDEAVNRRLPEVFNVINEVTREPVVSAVERCWLEGPPIERGSHRLLVRRDGTEYSVDDAASPITDREGRIVGVVLVFRDVTQQRRIAAQLAYQATHDLLTGLVNRFEFERRVEQVLQRAQVDETEHALCYIDLDQFKVVNDTRGHAAGDQLLSEVSRQLARVLRKHDTLARLGGDEFGVLLENCPPNQAVRIATELRDAMQQDRFICAGKDFHIGASIGVVMLNKATESLASAMSAADAACYVAKETGRNRVHVYNIEDHDLARRHSEMGWLLPVNKALASDGLRLYAQSIVPLRGGHAITPHYEILIRLLREDGELIGPNSFIPAAERYGLMPKIDRWVIGHVIDWCGRRVRAGHIPPVCGINLSGTSLSDRSLSGTIQEQLLQHNVAAESLYFEITETAAIHNIQAAAAFIRELKQIGCRFALDDFGSGVSSFSYLKNLEVDFVKISGEFVQDILRDPVDEAMVEAVNRVGHVMGIATIAEEAENQAILDRLRTIGVDFAQGFGVSRPAPLEELE